MKGIQKLFMEIFGLFVDDGPFATAILVWLGLSHWYASRIHPPAPWSGYILFSGLAIIVLVSAVHFSMKQSGKR